jgi:hypothetical protein
MASEIYIGTEKCDFSGDVNVIFSGGDLRDITEGRTASSYEISLPLTAANRKLLQYNNEINCFSEITDTGYVFVNGLLILKGKVKVISHIVGISADIIIQGTGWTDHFSDTKLRDVDLSSYNHVYNSTNIVASWTGAGNFYRYPMILFAQLFSQQYGATADWSANDFLPMFRIVDILEAIFAPWTISGGWLTDAAEDYILANETKASKDFIDGKDLDVKVNSTSDNNDSDTIVHDDTADVSFSFNPVSLQNEITDEASAWILGTNSYTINEDGTYNFKLYIKTNWSATNKSQLTINSQNITILLYKTDGITPTLLGQKAWSDYTGADILTLGEFTFENVFAHFEVGEYAYFQVDAQMNLTETSGSNQTVTLFLTTDSQLTLVWDQRCLYMGIGKTVDVASMLPDVTCIDFVKAIKQAYNLKFMPDLMNQVVYIENGDDTYTDNEREILNVDLSEVKTENIANNYKSVLNLRLKKDTGDNAIEIYLKTHSEPYVKQITLSSEYAEKGIEDYENNLFGYTVADYCYFLTPAVASVLRIFGKEDTVTEYDYTPAYRTTGFVPRLLRWVGLTSGSTWYLDGGSRSTWPKATTIDMAALYSTNFQKTFHLIDRGKLLTIEGKSDISLVQQFITVVNDINSEGFRAMYKIAVNGEYLYGYLNKIEFNGVKMRLELIIKH